MASFQGMNADVIGYICLFLSPSELAALAVSARVFRVEAERLLYRKLSWNGGRRMAYYRTWPLVNPDRPRALFVRSLSIEAYGSMPLPVKYALDECKHLTHLSLDCRGNVPLDPPRQLPPTLKSLEISWNVFRPEDLYMLLGKARALESLDINSWPWELSEDLLPHGALPALRSLTGHCSLVRALLPTRPTITSVTITSLFVDPGVIDMLAFNDIRHLEVMWEWSTIERICTACPNLESVHFREVGPEDLDDWLGGACPNGWKNLTSLRKLVIEFDLIEHEVVAADSAALLREQVKDIWPQLPSRGIIFYRLRRHLHFICAA